MTILDSTHKTAKPYEEVARAIRAAWEADSTAPFDLNEEEPKLLAVAAINALRRLGMINIDGLAAIKAEEAGKGT